MGEILSIGDGDVGDLGTIILPGPRPPAGEEMGELLVQELTGLPVIWKPLRDDGNTEFADHPHGEGYSLKEWERDLTLRENSPAFRQFLEMNPRASFDEWHNWKRAGLYVRVRMTKAEANGFWREDDDPIAVPYKDEKLGEWVPFKLRNPICRFKPEALLASKALLVGGNVFAQELLVAPDTAVMLLPGDAKRLVEPLDTFASAILTVGTGKTYAAIQSGLNAMSSGDTVAVFAGGVANVYTEQVTFPAFYVVNLVGMVAQQGITIQHTGTVVTMSDNTTGRRWRMDNFTIKNTNGAHGVTMSNNVYNSWQVTRCKMLQTAAAGTSIGLNGCTAAGNPQCIPQGVNCMASGFNNGFTSVASRVAGFSHCTAANCATAGFNGLGSGAAVLEACLAGGNTTDFTGTLSAVSSHHNVSTDATAVGVAPATGFLTADWEDMASADLRIRAAVKATTLALVVGTSRCREDYLGNIRRRSLSYYAGAHDPDPGIIPTAAQAKFGLTFGLDAELVGALEPEIIAPLGTKKST